MVDELLAVAAYIGAFLFVLGGCTVGAAAGYTRRTNRRRFPLGPCVLASLLPAALAFGLPWLFGREVRGGVLVILWLVAGGVAFYAESWLSHLHAGTEGSGVTGAEPDTAPDRPID